ncbi:MAG: putative PEP-binding protein [Gammaproteobacteria bacterium]
MVATSISEPHVYRAISVSPGVGFGRSCFCREQKNKSDVISADITKKYQDRLQAAFVMLTGKLRDLNQIAESNLDSDTATLFKAHEMICEEIEKDIINMMTNERRTVTEAIDMCFDFYTDYFSKLDESYFNARAADFIELKKLLVAFYTNSEEKLECRDSSGCSIGECILGNEHILIARQLSTHVIIKISKFTKGIITEKCNPNSHAAVIARSLNIPVVSGVSDIEQVFTCKDDILVNGDTGEIIVNPESSTLQQLKDRINVSLKNLVVVPPVEGLRVLADIDFHEAVKDAKEVMADGVGLYRTEFEMLRLERNMAEQEQYEFYKEVVEKIKPGDIYIRLLDIGSDKPADWLQHDKEDNPALGCRGARFLLQHPELLETQARALSRAAVKSSISVIYPMVSDIAQFKQLKNIFMNAAVKDSKTRIRHGIMFEVPSVCLNAVEFYELIDFGRIGSNDLVQYLFACDRSSTFFDYHTMVKDPAFWSMLNIISIAAHDAHKPVEICGMIMDFPEFVPDLIKLGINTVSTRPANIAAVRNAAQHYFH